MNFANKTFNTFWKVEEANLRVNIHSTTNNYLMHIYKYTICCFFYDNDKIEWPLINYYYYCMYHQVNYWIKGKIESFFYFYIKLFHPLSLLQHSKTFALSKYLFLIFYCLTRNPQTIISPGLRMFEFPPTIFICTYRPTVLYGQKTAILWPVEAGPVKWPHRIIS